jgi:glycerophosphoryl diester phosphodiesterase
MTTKTRQLLRKIANEFRANCKPLVLTDLAFKVIAFVVLTPLVGGLFRFFVSISGRQVLADEDILFYFLGPVGWLTLITVGATWLAIVALEQTALLAILSRREHGEVAKVSDGLAFAWRNATGVLKVTSRMVVWTLVVAVPFLAAGGAIYLKLLTEFDINFYLTTKPPEFWTAVISIGSILTVMAVVLVWLFSGWLLALPILLFENVAPAVVLKTSRARGAGHRTAVALWIFGWAAMNVLISAVATGIVGLVGRTIVPTATGSIKLLVIAVGSVMIVWGATALVTALVGATTFSVMLANLYRELSDREKLGTAADAGLAIRLPLALTRKTLIVGGVIAVLVAALVGVYTLKGVRLDDQAEIMAHRGASAAAPENTMAAILLAIEHEADWVEIDVQESLDGVVLVVHDSDLKKVGGSEKKIWEATAEELRSVEIGNWFDPPYPNQHVPTLEEVLVACKGKIGVNIELKHYGHAVNLEQRVIDLVEKHNMQDEIVLMSLKHDSVVKAKQLRPEWKIGLLAAATIGDLTQLEADFLAVNSGMATRSFVRRAHGNDQQVYVWTINDALTMSVMFGKGVDAIITDEPALARRVLAERAELSTVERVLLELALLFGIEPEKASAVEDA